MRASVEFVQEIAVSLQPVGGVRLTCPLDGAVILQFLVAQLWSTDIASHVRLSARVLGTANFSIQSARDLETTVDAIALLLDGMLFGSQGLSHFLPFIRLVLLRTGSKRRSP
jgi:hypothetical protein